jgi:hypothetical protein
MGFFQYVANWILRYIWLNAWSRRNDVIDNISFSGASMNPALESQTKEIPKKINDFWETENYKYLHFYRIRLYGSISYDLMTSLPRKTR